MFTFPTLLTLDFVFLELPDFGVKTLQPGPKDTKKACLWSTVDRGE